MKKILATILSFLLVFTLTACYQEVNNTDSTISDLSQDTISVASGESKSDDSDKNSSSDSNKPNNKNNNDTSKSTKNESSKSNTETTSKGVVSNQNNINSSTKNNSSKNNTETVSKGVSSSQNNINSSKKDNPSNSTVTSSNITSENIDNGVLENATTQKMDVPENMKLLGTNNTKEENNSKNIKATAVLYELDGDVVNWLTEDDLIYVITSSNNRLVVINSKNMTPVSNVPLAGKPAEINLIGDKIYISLPDLCRIDIFSKSDFTKKSSLHFEHEVSSFCVDGNYIYYSEHDQHCAVYKKNMTTNELTKILPDRGYTFYQPKLYLNKQDNILYIGDTGSSGSTIFYYNATTLELKSMFRKNDYGLFNHTRDIFHVGNDIFWGDYRLSDTNAKEIVGRYGEGNYGSVNFASEELVSTFDGLFLTDTYECIVNYFDAGFRFEYILVTDSYNFFFRSRGIDRNVILGVNFSMQ